MNERDAEWLGVAEGELVEVASRRGTVRAPARLGGMEPGHVFIPLLHPFEDAYGRRGADEPSDIRSAALPAMPSGSFGLLRDLHALYVMLVGVGVRPGVGRPYSESWLEALCSSMPTAVDLLSPVHATPP